MLSEKKNSRKLLTGKCRKKKKHFSHYSEYPSNDSITIAKVDMRAMNEL